MPAAYTECPAQTGRGVQDAQRRGLRTVDVGGDREPSAHRDSHVVFTQDVGVRFGECTLVLEQLAALHSVADDGAKGPERPHQIGEFFFHNRFSSVDNREIQRDVEHTVVFLVLFPACDHVLESIEVFLAQIVIEPLRFTSNLSRR